MNMIPTKNIWSTCCGLLLYKEDKPEIEKCPVPSDSITSRLRILNLCSSFLVQIQEVKIAVKAKLTKTIIIQHATNEQPTYHKLLCNQTLSTTYLQAFLGHYFDLEQSIQNHCSWMTATRCAGVVVMLKICIQKSLVWISDGTPAILRFSWFPSKPQYKYQDNTSIRPQLLPTKSLPNHYSPIILPFVVTYILWDTDRTMKQTTDKTKWLMQWNEH